MAVVKKTKDFNVVVDSILVCHTGNLMIILLTPLDQALSGDQLGSDRAEADFGSGERPVFQAKYRSIGFSLVPSLYLPY